MKEVMIFARHTKKWEFAHKEPFDFGGKAEQWVRRDGSSICAVSDEIAVQPVPQPPKDSGFSNVLLEAAQLIRIHVLDEENVDFDECEDESGKAVVNTLERLARVTREEWDFVRDLLKVEHECNENPLALSVLGKLEKE